MDYCGRLRTGDAVIIALHVGACASPNKNRLHTVPRRNAENDNRGDHMSKYLIEASKKNGLFQPYDPQKYYLVSKERLSKMHLQPVSWTVWSAKWVNLELTPLDQLESIYGEIEIID